MGIRPHVAVAQLAGARVPSVLGLEGGTEGGLRRGQDTGRRYLQLAPEGGELGGGARRSRLLLELLDAWDSGDQRPFRSLQTPLHSVATQQTEQK